MGWVYPLPWFLASVVGKSSLILVAIREMGLPSIYIDLRKFEERQYLSYRDFILELQHEVNNLTSRFPGLLDFLRNISGVSIMGNQVLFSWKSSNRASLSSLLDALNDWASNGVVIVLDEAPPELVKARGFNVLPVFAYAYDNLRKVRFIISGSKMGGLLYRFLRIRDPNHHSSAGQWTLWSYRPSPGTKWLNSLGGGVSRSWVLNLGILTPCMRSSVASRAGSRTLALGTTNIGIWTRRLMRP
ncbi:ATP-binding protein [Vulcanisaeta souniana]|uniref:ATP-binding protein n=1 Tax=Vulcanisaeta souniana TaxID=164452 RepID=UPI001FB1C724|nr:ATP-binding protein [Vulcanisaeta souniana]